MADKQKTVEIIFGGVDRTGGAVTSVGRNLDSLTNRVGDLTGPMASITDSIVKLDLALAAAGVGVTAYAVKLADDFDTAFGEISTVIGQPADNLRDFQAQILQYSESSTASLDEITSATYGAISAGVDYRNSLDLIAAAEQLSIAGKADLGGTTTALVSTMNAFGASADEAAAYADTFFTTVQLGQTTIPELSSAIGRLAPIAAAAGLDFEEMGAAIATITAETGTGTAEAITGIRAAITAMLKPTKEARDVAAGLGIEFSAAALESKGFSGVLEEVALATGGNVETMAKLFGSVEALAPVLALTGNASDKFGENLKAFENNAGAAETAASQLGDSLSLITQTLKNSLNSALIGFGANLTDETQGIVKSISSIFSGIGAEIRLDDGVFAPILDGMEGLAQSIDQKLKVIAENFPEALANMDFTELLASFGDLGDQLGDLFTGLFGDVDLGTVEGLQSAMQRVVDAFTALVNVSAGIADGLEPLFRAIGTGIEKFEDLDEGTKRSVGEILGVGKAIDTILPAIGGLAGGLESIGTGLTALAGAQGFKALISNLGSVKALAAGAGKGGLIGLALAGGYGVGTLINEYILGPMEEKFGTSIGSWLYDAFNADELERIAQSFQPVSAAMQELHQDTRDLRDMNASLSSMLNDTTVASKETQDGWQAHADSLVAAANKQAEVTEALDTSGGALGKVSTATEKLAEANKGLVIGYDAANGKANSFSGTIIKGNKALDDTAKKTEEVIKKSEEYQMKMMELSSNERIKNIEAKVSLDIAEVEANAKQVEAIAQTISDTFSSTGDVISSLFGGFDDASRMTQIELAKQIREEQKMRQQSLDDQSKLTDAQVDLIKQKTRALQRGDAMIKVDGAGLQPHLEAFMFEILREIQVRVNADGEEMLLGLN